MIPTSVLSRGVVDSVSPLTIVPSGSVTAVHAVNVTGFVPTAGQSCVWAKVEDTIVVLGFVGVDSSGRWVGEGTQVVVLKLSTTDAAANDAAIDAAIASFPARSGYPGDRTTGVIYAPANPYDPIRDAWTVWPIAASHEFGRVDLRGSGMVAYSLCEPNTPFDFAHDVGNGGTTFVCTTAGAGFKFSNAGGGITGDFVISGGGVAVQPFQHHVASDTGMDLARTLQNVYVCDSGLSADRGVNVGVIVTARSGIGTYGAPAHFVLTATNAGGAQSTGSINYTTATAADIQTALEALSNVGAGNVAVTCDEYSDTPAQGMPFYFAFNAGLIGSDTTLTVDIEDVTNYLFPIVLPDPTDDGAYAFSIMNTYLETFVNIGVGNAGQHGFYLRENNCRTRGITMDGAQGVAVTLSQSNELQLSDGELDTARLGHLRGVTGGFSRDNVFDGFEFYDNGFQNGSAVTVTANDTIHIRDSGIESNWSGPGVNVTNNASLVLSGIFDYDRGVAIAGTFDNLSFNTHSLTLLFYAGATLDQGTAQFATGVSTPDSFVLSGAFATADRPTGIPVGGTVFDTDLGKPIWSNGLGGWVDAAGTVV